MDTKKEYVEKMEAQLMLIDAKIKEISAKAKNAKADTLININKQLDAMKEKKSNFTGILDRIKEGAEDSWDELKIDAENAWQDLKVYVDKAITA